MRRALDLFCGAGGVCLGLQRAGFEVTGVDIEPQPRYPGRFVKADVFSLPHTFFRGYDLIWASPKCQFATAYKRRMGHVRESPNQIPGVRAIFAALSAPTVIENVEGARGELVDPIMLCGSMFQETIAVRRHRYFETSFPIPLAALPQCNHAAQKGAYPAATNRRALSRSTVEIGVRRIPLPIQRAAMGINTPMTLHELSQSIPPAYAEYIGRLVP